MFRLFSLSKFVADFIEQLYNNVPFQRKYGVYLPQCKTKLGYKKLKNLCKKLSTQQVTIMCSFTQYVKLEHSNIFYGKNKKNNEKHQLT